MKHLLPTAESNLLTTCLDYFCKNCAPAHLSTSLEASILSLGFCDIMMNNIKKSRAHRFL